MIQTWIPKGRRSRFIDQMKGLGIGHMQNKMKDTDQGTSWKDVHSSWITYESDVCFLKCNSCFKSTKYDAVYWREQWF